MQVGGPIGLVKDGDVIRIDADTLEILAGKARAEEAQDVLQELQSLAERIVVSDESREP